MKSYIFILILFVIVAAISVTVISAGNAVYENISENIEDNYNSRVMFSYLATKIRQNNIAGNIYFEEKNGINLLVLADGDYVTYIYCYGGYLRELYVETETEFEPGWGDEIVACAYGGDCIDRSICNRGCVGIAAFFIRGDSE